MFSVSQIERYAINAGNLSRAAAYLLRETTQNALSLADRPKEFIGDTKYLVSRRVAGLGDCLISLVGAWRAYR